MLARLAVAIKARDTAQLNVYAAILASVDGGCSLADIGREMGIDRQTVRWHITKARDTQEKT